MNHLLTFAFEKQASDLHISKGIPAVLRINGKLKQFNEHIFSSSEIKNMLNQLLPSSKIEQFNTQGEIDFNYSVEGICRFRINAYYEGGEIALAIRLIPTEIPTIEQLGMPNVLFDLVSKPQGLILVTGPTGSGKTTTLAAMIHSLNTKYAKHIITLEDPIEYVHDHQKSIIHQREIGVDTLGFANGLRSALRQDPDIILVGELRDLETISTAITAAETGHLVLATLHTNSAASTIDRIIDVFPPHQQFQVRLQLSNVLQGVIAQRLFVRKDQKGRVAATEILVQTPAVSNLIRSEKTQQLRSVMQMNRSLGMHTLATSIQQLVTNEIISMGEARPYLTEGDVQ